MSEVQEYIPEEELGADEDRGAKEAIGEPESQPEEAKPAEGEKPKETERIGNPSYPDQMDWAFCGGILGPYEQVRGEGSWAQEEAVALQRVKDRVTREVSPTDGKLVDAGCGMGRLSVEFAPMFGSIIAVEPDERRIQEAISNVIESDLTDKIEFQNTTIQKMEVSSADTAICSHIIQHVPAESIPGILQKLNDALKDNGTLVLSTNNSGQDADRYTKLYWNGSVNIEEEISQEEFEGLHGNQDGILPIHWFSKSTLEHMLQQGGFEIEDSYLYHNLEGDGGEGGRDVQIIARKKTA